MVGINGTLTVADGAREDPGVGLRTYEMVGGVHVLPDQGVSGLA